MNKGDMIYTPRFCTVEIKEVFESRIEAVEAGYNEPTHFQNGKYGILGKMTGINRMEFAGFKK